jgi:uncharacterized protein (DUF1330 family)
MKKGYWVVLYHAVHDQSAIDAYLPLAKAAITEAGGVTLIRTVATEVHEQGIPQRTVITEFSSYQVALDAYNSAAYAKAKEALGTTATVRDFRIVEGV